MTKKIEVFASEALPGELEAFPDIKRGWGTTKEITGGIPPMKWFNAIQKRTDEAINAIAEGSISGYTFKDGATLDSHKDLIYDDVSKSWYFWIGESGKVIPPNSNASEIIESDGGVWSDTNPNGLWVNVGDASLRGELGTYTILIYKASDGRSAVDNMILGFPKIARVGDVVSTGGTMWKRVSYSNNDITDFQAISELKSKDFRADNENDLSAVLLKMIAAKYPDIQINEMTGNFATPIATDFGVNIRGLGVTKSLFTKSFDSYLFPDFATGSELKDLQIVGGKSSMILFKTGTERQFLNRVRLIPSGGFKAIVFESRGGHGLQCDSCTLGSGDTGVAGAGMLEGVVDSSSAERHFTNCSGAGNPLLDLSGMNDTFIVSGFSTNGLIFSDNTSKAFISNMRWGVSTTNPVSRVEVRGENINISNEVGLPLDLYCSASRVSTITPDYDINDYGKGNMLSVRPRAYLPTFTGSGSIKPSIGSGSIKGFYSREGGRITIQVEIIWSSDSTMGNGRFIIGLPENMPPVQSIWIQQYNGSGQVRSENSISISGRFTPNEKYFELSGVNGAGNRVDVGVDTPLSSGDRIWFQGDYVV